MAPTGSGLMTAPLARSSPCATDPWGSAGLLARVGPGRGARGRADAVRRPARPATAVNRGAGTGTTVRELLAAFNRVPGRPVEVREAGRRPGDAVGACSRIDRAERLLGWRPQYDLAEGISHSLQWAALRKEILPG